MLLAKALEWAQKSLANRFKNDAGREAYELLLCLDCFKNKSEIIINLHRVALSETQVIKFSELIDRRANGEPLAYLRGYEYFCGRAFIVSPEVLIPRPETELIPQRAQELAATSIIPQNAQCIDIGTGSGALAATLKLELPEAEWLACDVSFQCLSLARINFERLNADVKLLQSFCLRSLKGSFDLIVSNPPYLDIDDRTIQPEVHQFEPHLALYSPKNGLELIYEIIDSAHQLLKLNGKLLMEIGAGQYSILEPLLKSSNFFQYSCHHDWNNFPRILELTK